MVIERQVESIKPKLCYNFEGVDIDFKGYENSQLDWLQKLIIENLQIYDSQKDYLISANYIAKYLDEKKLDKVQYLFRVKMFDLEYEKL